MIKIFIGKKDKYEYLPATYGLENSYPVSAAEASSTFTGSGDYMLGKYDYMEEYPRFGPNLEEIYQAFRVRLLWELKDHIPGLVEIVEEDVDDDSED